jgi:Reverse transcriptase (RNA-dependent DNA polymerase)
VVLPSTRSSPSTGSAGCGRGNVKGGPVPDTSDTAGAEICLPNAWEASLNAGWEVMPCPNHIPPHRAGFWCYTYLFATVSRRSPCPGSRVVSEVQRMLKAGFIKPTTSEWARPVVLVPKPDGSMRLCIDYRRLNALTVRDSYPLPRMEECIDSLGDATIFSTLGCDSVYWQIPVHPDDRAKPTFTSHEGLYRFLRMPFGLRNAPATFQRFVDITLAGLIWKICLVYLDDIIVFSKSNEKHLEHLDAVLNRLFRAGLSLNLKICYFPVIRPATWDMSYLLGSYLLRKRTLMR